MSCEQQEFGQGVATLSIVDHEGSAKLSVDQTFIVNYCHEVVQLCNIITAIRLGDAVDVQDVHDVHCLRKGCHCPTQFRLGLILSRH